MMFWSVYKTTFEWKCLEKSPQFLIHYPFKTLLQYLCSVLQERLSGHVLPCSSPTTVAGPCVVYLLVWLQGGLASLYCETPWC